MQTTSSCLWKRTQSQGLGFPLFPREVLGGVSDPKGMSRLRESLSAATWLTLALARKAPLGLQLSLLLGSCNCGAESSICFQVPSRPCLQSSVEKVLNFFSSKEDTPGFRIRTPILIIGFLCLIHKPSECLVCMLGLGDSEMKESVSPIRELRVLLVKPEKLAFMLPVTTRTSK